MKELISKLGRAIMRLGGVDERKTYHPRLQTIEGLGLPRGVQSAILLLERALVDNEPLDFTPEDLALALGMRIAWLAREMDAEHEGNPSLAEQSLGEFDAKVGRAMEKVTPFARDRIQLLYLLGLMAVEVVESVTEGGTLHER